MPIGKRIAAARARSGQSVEQVVQRLHEQPRDIAHADFAWLEAVESGQHLVGSVELYRIAEALDTTSTVLLGTLGRDPLAGKQRGEVEALVVSGEPLPAGLAGRLLGSLEHAEWAVEVKHEAMMDACDQLIAAREATSGTPEVV